MADKTSDGRRPTMSLKRKTTVVFPGKAERPRDRANRDEMDHLQRLMDTGRETAALDYIDDLIKKFPTDIVLYLRGSSICNGLGKDARRNGDTETAYGHFEDAARYALNGLSERAANVKLLCVAGNAYRELDMFSKAEAMYERAVYIHPDDKYAYTGMGLNYHIWSRNLDTTDQDRKSELLQNAADAFQSAVLIDPEDDFANRMLRESQEKGYEPNEDGYDLDDPALDLILNGDPDLYLENDEPELATPRPPRPGSSDGR